MFVFIFVFSYREGLTIDYMSAELRGALFGEQIVSFFRLGSDTRREILPFHRFQQGDVVIVSKRSPTKDAVLEGVVMERNADGLLITTKDTIPRGFTNTKWVNTRNKHFKLNCSLSTHILL